MYNLKQRWWVSQFWNRLDENIDLDDVEGFLNHLLVELNREFPPEVEDTAEDENNPADFMRKLIRTARYHLGDTQLMPTTAMFFFMLGVTAQDLTNPDSVDDPEIPFKGLNLFNSYRRELRILAQTFAESAWKDGSKLRVQEMAESVWVTIIDFLNHRKEEGDTFTDEMFKAGPNDAKGLIPWIREVAPDFARRPGRPLKKS